MSMSRGYQPLPCCNNCRANHRRCDFDVDRLIGCTKCKEFNIPCQAGDQALPVRPDHIPPVLRGSGLLRGPRLECDYCQVDPSRRIVCDVDGDHKVGCVRCEVKNPRVLCTLNGEVLAQRPRRGDPRMTLIRHNCDSCQKRSLKTCSWLTHSDSRLAACENCIARGINCLRDRQAPDVHLIPGPGGLQLPPILPFDPQPPQILQFHGYPQPPQNLQFYPPPPQNLQMGPQPPQNLQADPQLPPIHPQFQSMAGADVEMADADDLAALLGDYSPPLPYNDADFDLSVHPDPAQNLDQVEIHPPPAQAPLTGAELARKVLEYMQRRAQDLKPHRYINPQALEIGGVKDDPRLGHDPFAPPPRPDDEALRHQFPPDLDWLGTRFAYFKIRGKIAAPEGVPEQPLSPGGHDRLWKGNEQQQQQAANPGEAAAPPQPQPEIPPHHGAYPGNLPALASLPTRGGEAGGHRADLVGRACEEHLARPGPEWTTCGQAVEAPVTHCPDRNHAAASPAVVCADCNDRSKSMVLSADAEQLREAEVLAARAYTCCVCLAAGAAERVSFALCGHGVWGYEEEAGELSAAVPDGEGVVRGGFMGSPTPVWGCGCAKLLSTMCQAHRLMHAELWLTQVRLMNEWIVGKYGRKVCPLCHVKGRPAVNEFNFEGQLGGEGVDKLAWACVSCQEFVVVPRNLGKGLLPGIETMVIDVNSYYRRSSEIYTSGTREGWVPQM